MPIDIPALQAFNRGRISPLALARTDVKRVGLSAEVQTNWVPRVLGSMSLRPGMRQIGATASNAKARNLEFIARVDNDDDKALIEVTGSVIRVWKGDALITRPAVSSAITNGTFTTDLTGWTDADEVGATSSHHVSGYLSLVGTRFNAAIRRQQVTVAGSDQNVVHALTIVIIRGPVTLKVGSTAGGGEYVAETSLGTGNHSIAFTPTGDFHIELSSRTQYAALVDSIAVASGGVMTLPSPWAEADLGKLRYDQSVDVLFIDCDGYRPYKLERRDNDSWSLVHYQPLNGPMRAENVGPISLSVSALSGDVVMAASKSFFRSGHVGALFRLSSGGQLVEIDASGADQFTDPVKVTGVGGTRQITYEAAGTFTATVTLQRSIGEPGIWTDVTSSTVPTGAIPYNDGLDNQEVYYRIGIKAGAYTSGTATVSINYGSGSITGYALVTAYVSGIEVDAAVLIPFGSTAGTQIWAEGEWSDYRGWPSAVAFHEGRLFHAGKDKIWGSESDAFESFDFDAEGDAGPISRSIGSGPLETVNWLVPMQRLLVGGQAAEYSVRSTTFDEPLTPTNFNSKPVSTQGSRGVEAQRIDTRAVFVQRGGIRVFELGYSLEMQDYESIELSSLVPEIGKPSVVHTAVQRLPDTRVHFVRSDGTVALLVYDKNENTICWLDVETPGAGGLVEDVAVLPGDEEDQVYYVVKRTIDGATVRYLERWAMESECIGGTLNKQADAFIEIDQASSVTVTGLSTLEGETVVVWGNGKDLGSYAVSGGQITVSEAVTTAIVGLAYSASYKSVKLAYAAASATALSQPKRVAGVALILANTHAQGVRYGGSLTTTYALPLNVGGKNISADSIWSHFDNPSIPLGGEWTTDSRLCLTAAAPRPATVLAAVLPMQTNDRV